MTENDKRKLAALMTQASDVYKRDVSETLLDTYWKLLSAYEIADIERAFAEHMLDADNGRFFPLPAHLAAKLSEQTTQMQKQKFLDEMEKRGLREDGNEKRKNFLLN